MKKIISILLLYVISFNIYAGAAEQWTIEKVVYDNLGKNLTYTASRVNALAGNDLVYKAKVPVTAAATGSTVAAMVRTGLAGAAIYGILAGVGWIIENGVVKKKVDPDYDGYEYCHGNNCFKYSSSLMRYLEANPPSALNSTWTQPVKCRMTSDTKFTCSAYNTVQKKELDWSTGTISRKLSTTPPEYVPVPENEIGNEVNNSSQAPQVLPDIYNPNNPSGGAAPQKTADALENAVPQPRENPKSVTEKKPNKDTDGDGVPDVYDPALPDLGETTEWPEACSWFPVICEWYIKYKQDSDLAKEHREAEKDVWVKEDIARQEEKTAREEEKEQRKDEKSFWQKVEDWFDWTKEEPNNDDADNEVQPINDPLPNIDTSIFGASGECPPDFSYAFPLPMGGTYTITYSYATVCYWFSKLYYIVVSVAWVIAFRIVTNTNTGNSENG